MIWNKQAVPYSHEKIWRELLDGSPINPSICPELRFAIIPVLNDQGSPQTLPV